MFDTGKGSFKKKFSFALNLLKYGTCGLIALRVIQWLALWFLLFSEYFHGFMHACN